MKYTAERKDKADDQMTKATKRFKRYAKKSEGDYGDVTHQPDLRSEDTNMQDLLQAIINEAKVFEGSNPRKSTDPSMKCGVCGGSHHPAAKHTARALAPENNQVSEAAMPLRKAVSHLEKKGFKKTGATKDTHHYAHSDGRKAQIKTHTTHDCPDCGSDKHLSFHDYDYGRDSETGYSDSGERYHCHKCGSKGDADDTKNHHGKIVSEGLGPVVNGKQKPITPYKNSWADQEAKRDKTKVHPLAKPMYPGATTLPGKYDRHGNKIAEDDRPTPDELEKATLCKKSPDGKEVLDEKPMNEAKSKKGPKWNGNSLSIKTTQADINRKAAATVGMPPPKQVIKSKKDKGEKHKKNWRDMMEDFMNESEHEDVLKAHGYKHDGGEYSSEGKRYEHKDSSHVMVYPHGGWEHKGKNKSLVASKGDSAKSLDSHLKKVASRARSAANSKAKDDAMRSLGLTKVKGARGGTYWE